MILKLTLICLCLIIIEAESKSSVKLVNIAHCSVDPSPAQEGFNLTESYQDGKLSGELTIPYDIDDDVEYSMTFAKMVDGKWHMDSTTISGNFCDAVFLYVPDLAKSLLTAIDVPNSCPIAANTYTLKDFSVDEGQVNFPDFGENAHYQINVTFSRQEQPVVCRVFEIKN